MIGKRIYSKYDGDSDDEYEVNIGLDEKLIGFRIRQSDWEDCKIAQVSFKIAKCAEPDEAYVEKVNAFLERKKDREPWEAI